MSSLNEYMQEILPELKNTAHLFSIPDSVWAENDGSFRYTVSEKGGEYICSCSYLGQTLELKTPVPAEEEDQRLTDLHRKRAARRLCKHAVYLLCRQVTGIHPPWGSLTGIRPTHLIYEAMQEGLSTTESAMRVQQAFDLSPVKAGLLKETVDVQLSLTPLAPKDIDIYIGIPFCTTRCAYCSFSSGEIGNGRLVEPYLHALFHEIDACAELLHTAGRKLRALYVGGGTPTSLSDDQFCCFLEKVLTRFPDAMEYTVEAGRPDTITGNKLHAIRQAGIHRISINPQTMVDRTLQLIGRNHTAAQVTEAYAAAREAGIHHINMDVIAGLPGETCDDFRCTMDAAMSLRPESLTVHTLAIKRSSRLHLEKAPLPDSTTAEQMVEMGAETASAMHMKPYYLYRQKYMAGNQENVGYALPGHACLYNVDIMEERADILALGAGGISKRIYPDEGHIGRAPNVSNIEQYIARTDEMIQRKRDLFEASPAAVTE